MIKKTTKRVSIGVKLGYPQCCIDSFLNGRSARDMSEREFNRMDKLGIRRSGFIPCKKCLEQSRRSLIKRINKRRDKSLPKFPSPYDGD